MAEIANSNFMCLQQSRRSSEKLDLLRVMHSVENLGLLQ